MGGPCDAADIEIQFRFGFGLNDTEYNFAAETATITHYIFGDSDGDGFTNPYEEALGSDETNPASTPSDFDGDGVTNAEDAFPNDASETLDTDGDGVGDNADAFPNDPSNWAPYRPGSTVPVPVLPFWGLLSLAGLLGLLGFRKLRA